MYGILVKNCFVRDGVGMGGEEKLYDERGCSVENLIMGELRYSDDLTRAEVLFKAHKFPYTSSLVRKGGLVHGNGRYFSSITNVRFNTV